MMNVLPANLFTDFQENEYVENGNFDYKILQIEKHKILIRHRNLTFRISIIATDKILS